MKKIKKPLVFAVFSLLLLPYFSGNIQAQNFAKEIDLDNVDVVWCECKACKEYYLCALDACDNPDCPTNTSCYCDVCNVQYYCVLTAHRNCSNNNNNNNNNNQGSGGGGPGNPQNPPNNPTTTIDCQGVTNGKAYMDNCGRCVGGTTGLTPCTQDCSGKWGGTAYKDNCQQCVGGNTGRSPCVKDCNNVWGGTAYLDPYCPQCVGGNTGKVPCDCNGDIGGTAIKNSCGECVGGNTEKEECYPCIPKTFNYTKFVTPVSENISYDGYGWCAFLTLATLKGGDPCTYATVYYQSYLPQLGIPGCNSTMGVQARHLIGFYQSYGLSFGGTAYDKCSFVNGMSPGGKGLIVTPSGHVYLIYGIHRNSGGEYTMDKYDTYDFQGWIRAGIDLEIPSDANAKCIKIFKAIFINIFVYLLYF